MCLASLKRAQAVRVEQASLCVLGWICHRRRVDKNVLSQLTHLTTTSADQKQRCSTMSRVRQDDDHLIKLLLIGDSGAFPLRAASLLTHVAFGRRQELVVLSRTASSQP